MGRRTKTFLVVRDGGCRIKIGCYPTTSLHDARKEAKRLLALAEAPRVSSRTISTVVALFLDSRTQSNRRATKLETERLLTRHLLPTLAETPITEVTTDQVTSIIDNLVDTPGTANHAYVAMQTFFNWCVARRYINQSPIAGIPRPAKLRKRDRVLTDAEQCCPARFF